MERPSILGAVPLGPYAALPESETTTASVGCAAAESVTSQTAMRSLSMIGCDAVGEPAWNRATQRNRARIMGTAFRKREARIMIAQGGSVSDVSVPAVNISRQTQAVGRKRVQVVKLNSTHGENHKQDSIGTWRALLLCITL